MTSAGQQVPRLPRWLAAPSPERASSRGGRSALTWRASSSCSLPMSARWLRRESRGCSGSGAGCSVGPWRIRLRLGVLSYGRDWFAVARRPRAANGPRRRSTTLPGSARARAPCGASRPGRRECSLSVSPRLPGYVAVGRRLRRDLQHGWPLSLGRVRLRRVVGSLPGLVLAAAAKAFAVQTGSRPAACRRSSSRS